MNEPKYQFKQELETNPKGKLLKGHLSPAYNRLCITSVQVLDLFNRGLDFENHDPLVSGKYCSIRDFAPGASIQFRYGKRLQKTFTHTV